MFHEEFQVWHKREVDPLTISKVVAANLLGKIVEYGDAYVGTKHYVRPIQIVGFHNCTSNLSKGKRSPISTTKFLLH
jgi:hypothetical protein